MKRSSVVKYEKKMKQDLAKRSILKMIISVLASIGVELAMIAIVSITTQSEKDLIFYTMIIAIIVAPSIIYFMYEDCKRDATRVMRSLKRLKSSIEITEE